MKFVDLLFVGVFLITFGMLSSIISAPPAPAAAYAAYNVTSARVIEQSQITERRKQKASRANKRRVFIEKVSRSRTPLSDKQLRTLLTHTGFKGDSLELAVRIVHRESRNNPLVHNTNAGTGDNSYGLFQINMIGSLGPARRNKFNLQSNDELFNPVKNAEIAYYMSGRGKNFSAWKCYSNGCVW